MTDSQGRRDQILAELSNTVREIAALTRRRDALILDAVLEDVPRKEIATRAGLSEPMVYKIRRDQLELRKEGPDNQT